MDKEISVAVISEPIGKRPEEVAYSFLFDESIDWLRRMK